MVMISKNNTILKNYSRDKSVYEIKPSYVAFPKSVVEVVEVIQFAKENKLTIAARGGGTGLSGAALTKGIVIDFSKYLNKVIKTGKTTVIQSGTLLKKLRPIIRNKGYMLPSVPLHNACAIGGNINTRSVGPRTLKYGPINNQVKSLTAILIDGRIIDTSQNIPLDIKQKLSKLRNKLKKEKSLVRYINKRPFTAGGYNLKAFLESKNSRDMVKNLLIGSTGTLALITEVSLKLPRYKKLNLYLLHFKNYDLLQKALDFLLKLSPASLEYAGKMVLDIGDKEYQNKNSIAALMVGFESNKNLSSIKKYTLELKQIRESQQKRLWKSRALALPKLEEKAKSQGLQIPSFIDDTSINPKDFSKVIKEVKKYSKKHKVKIADFGHIGVGSIHLRAFIKNKKKFDKIGRDIFKIVKKYNGTLIGEHNSGFCRSRYLIMENKKMYQYMKKIKEIFDPDNLLNPKILFNLDKITKNIKS